MMSEEQNGSRGGAEARRLKGLPKARLLGIMVRPAIGTKTPWFAKFRGANWAMVWIGPIEIVWRMPWLRHSAKALYPHLFDDPRASTPLRETPASDVGR